MPSPTTPRIPGPALFPPGKPSRMKQAIFEAVEYDHVIEEAPQDPTFEVVGDDVYINNDDGSVTIEKAGKPNKETAELDDFYANLADGVVSQEELSRIAMDLLHDIEVDQRDREQRDKQYAEGIKRTGIGEDAPGGAEFEGASRATHPMLAEGCVDFAARAIKELFPAKGPCRTQVIGPQTREQLEKAERKKTFMNWQLTSQISEYRNQLEICLTQVPLGGSQYMKVTLDRLRKRPKVEFVPVDNVFLPFSATDFYTAERVTHMQFITRFEYGERVRAKEYISIGDLGSPVNIDEATAAQQVSDKAEGREESGLNEDGVRKVYETQLYLALKDDPKGKEEDGEQVPLPYIVVIDDTTRKVVSLRRNWDDEDEKCEKLHWIVEFGLIPWRGAYKIGLAHLIGSLSGAATGALRALLDAALIENFPGGLRMKGVGGSLTGQNKMAGPTELTEIEAPPNVDDIRKLVMPYPFNGPSAVLYQLLEWITQHGTQFISTAEERLGDSATNAPVGTTLAMIEQGSITYMSIHGRLHESQKRVFEIIHRIDSYIIEDKFVVKELGSHVVYADDFQGPMDVIPVSDPNIFSDAQRFAQIQAVLGMAEKYPQFYKMDQIQKRVLLLLNFQGADEILNVPGDPKPRNAILENVEARKQEVMLKAYPDQDHLLHLQMHLQFMTSPIWCANEAMAMPALPKLIEHCAEHFIALYNDHANAAIEAYQAVGMLNEQNEEEVMHDALVTMDTQVAQMLSQIMPLWQQAQQLAKQFQPQPPMDPMVQVKQMEISARQASDQADQQLEQRKQAFAEQLDQIVIRAEQATAQMQAASAERQTMIKQQAENSRHDAEMGIAARNADIAAEGDQLKAHLAQFSSQLAEQGANERAALTAQVQLLLGQMKADQANYLQEIQSTLTMVQELFKHVQHGQVLENQTQLAGMQADAARIAAANKSSGDNA